MLVRDEDVDASVAVEVAEDGVARVAAAGETEARRCLGEGPVEIVAVHGALTVSDEKEVQVAVVIEVDEERPPGALFTSATPAFAVTSSNVPLPRLRNR